MTMPSCIPHSFNQCLLLPHPPIAYERTNVSTLAAEEGQMIAARIDPRGIESLVKSSIEQATWGIGWSEPYTRSIKATPSCRVSHKPEISRSLLSDLPSDTFQNDREIVLYTQAIKQALQTEQVRAARNIFTAIPSNLAVDPKLTSIGRLLALPIVHVTMKRDTDRTLEFNWLRTEGHKYRGLWVAVENDRLLVTAPTLKALRDQLKSMHSDISPLIHRIA